MDDVDMGESPVRAEPTVPSGVVEREDVIDPGGEETRMFATGAVSRVRRRREREWKKERRKPLLDVSRDHSHSCQHTDCSLTAHRIRKPLVSPLLPGHPVGGTTTRRSFSSPTFNSSSMPL